MILVGVVLLALLGGVVAYYISSRDKASLSTGTDIRHPLPGVVSIPVSQAPSVAVPGMTVPEGRSAPPRTPFSGTVLAGTHAPLLDFTQADYEAALASGRLVFLYFYANWCPICREEFPVVQAVFNGLTTDQVVGFRVNFNDDQTDAQEEALAREHGVAYQHTKVMVRSGQRILKSPETWTKERYVTEINGALH